MEFETKVHSSTDINSISDIQSLDKPKAYNFKKWSIKTLEKVQEPFLPSYQKALATTSGIIERTIFNTNKSSVLESKIEEIRGRAIEKLKNINANTKSEKFKKLTMAKLIPYDRASLDVLTTLDEKNKFDNDLDLGERSFIDRKKRKTTVKYISSGHKELDKIVKTYDSKYIKNIENKKNLIKRRSDIEESKAILKVSAQSVMDAIETTLKDFTHTTKSVTLSTFRKLLQTSTDTLEETFKTHTLNKESNLKVQKIRENTLVKISEINHTIGTKKLEILNKLDHDKLENTDRITLQTLNSLNIKKDLDKEIEQGKKVFSNKSETIFSTSGFKQIDILFEKYSDETYLKDNVKKLSEVLNATYQIAINELESTIKNYNSQIINLFSTSDSSLLKKLRSL